MWTVQDSVWKATTEEVVRNAGYRWRGERRARRIVDEAHVDGRIFTWREGGRWHIGGRCPLCGWSRPL